MSTAVAITSAEARSAGGEPLVGDDIPSYKTFDELGVSDDLLRGIFAYGFERPSPVQERAVRPLIDGRDVIAQAPSGTGKTGAFTVGVLARINPSNTACQALILEPTRELAEQTFTVASSLATYMDGVRVVLCTGGVRDARGDIAALRAGAQVVVATPGRAYFFFMCVHAIAQS